MIDKNDNEYLLNNMGELTDAELAQESIEYIEREREDVLAAIKRMEEAVMAARLYSVKLSKVLTARGRR